MQLAVKRHFFFIQLRMNRGNGLNVDIEDLVVQRGNCIYAALFHLRIERVTILLGLAVPNPTNATAAKTGYRVYRDVCRDLGIKLAPTLSRDLEVNKQYLLHLENDGNPHCVGVEIIKHTTILVYHMKQSYTLSRVEFDNALYGAMDESTAIFYEVGIDVSVEMGKLLDCMAGAGSSDDVEAVHLFAINVADDSAEEEIDAWNFAMTALQ